MKLKSVALFICGIAVAQAAIATNDVCRYDHGTMRCSAGDVDSVSYLGKTVLSGTHVRGKIWVVGNLDANNADAGAATITGNVDLSHFSVSGSYYSIGFFRADNSEFNGETKIVGDMKSFKNIYKQKTEVTGDGYVDNDTYFAPAIFTGKLHAEASRFNSLLSLTACTAEFNQSNLNDIQVGVLRNCPEGVQKIYLNDKSQVHNRITFLGGNGRVYLSKDSAIAGQVIGGTVVRE